MCRYCEEIEFIAADEPSLATLNAYKYDIYFMPWGDGSDGYGRILKNDGKYYIQVDTYEPTPQTPSVEIEYCPKCNRELNNA